MATATPDPIERLDVPVGQLAADVAALAARRRLAACRAAECRHLLDPLDGAFAVLPAEHPENVTYDHDWQPGGTS
ncbi:hypothetical protein [Streptomyces syringium]|uniref:hypothetical protein n=1 Tax=Streptomyces syringium TaxID=76729 RepID=UPI003AAFBAB6